MASPRNGTKECWHTDPTIPPRHMSSSLYCQSTINSSRSTTMGNFSRVACTRTSLPSSMFDQNMNAQEPEAAKPHRPPRFCIASASCSTRVLTGIDASAKVGDTPILTANDVQDETQFVCASPSSLYTSDEILTTLRIL